MLHKTEHETKKKSCALLFLICVAELKLLKCFLIHHFTYLLLIEHPARILDHAEMQQPGVVTYEEFLKHSMLERPLASAASLHLPFSAACPQPGFMKRWINASQGGIIRSARAEPPLTFCQADLVVTHLPDLLSERI